MAGLLYKNNLSVVCWNIQSVKKNHISLLEDNEVLNKLTQYDIICLTETHAKDPQELSIKGYSSYQVTRPKLHRARKFSGGIAVFVKNEIRPGIKFIHSESLPSDVIWLKLCNSFFKGWDTDKYLGIAYFSPINSTYTKRLDIDYFELLEQEIVKYSSLGSVMITGDLNARSGVVPDYIDDDGSLDVNFIDGFSADVNVKLPKRDSHDKTVNQYGRSLLDLCKSCDLNILNGRTLGDCSGKFTCHEVAGSSVVDYTLVQRDCFSDIRYFNVSAFDALVSDHCSIEFGLKVKFHINKEKKSYVDKSLDVNKFKWTTEAKTNFVNALQMNDIGNNLNDLADDSNTSVDDMIDGFSNIMLQLANKCLIKRGANKKRKKQPKWYDNECFNCRKTLKSLNRSFHKNPFNPDIREKLFHTKKVYKRLVRDKKRKFKADILEKINDLHNNDPAQYWNLLKELKQSQQTLSNPADKISPNEWEHYFSSLLDRKSETSQPFLEDLNLLEQTKVFNELNFRITEKEVKTVIKNLKCNKAVGLDHIANEMLKSGLDVLCTPLTKIFNIILNSGHFPTLWRNDYISPIHKAGSQSNPSNYRGITICSNLGKVFTAVLNNRLDNFVEDHKILKEEQIGFRHGSRTADHMFILKALIDKYTKNKEKLYVCFIDLKKAFDSIWRDGMLLKLLKCGISGNFYNIIKSMYADVKCTVKTCEGFTSFFKSSVGVKQGEVLSPLLFNLYINDMLDIFTDRSDPVDVCDRKLNALLYADDLILLSESEAGLQTCLNQLHSYCQLWKLQVNISKSKVIVFNKSGRLYGQNFIYDNMPLESVKHYKYLGVFFSNSGNFSYQKMNQKDKALRAAFKLKKTICGENLSPGEAIKLFKKCVFPVGLYGAEIWGNLISSNKIFKHFENLPFERVLMMFSKSLLGVNKKACNDGVRGELGLFPVYFDIIVAIVKYYRRLDSLEDSSLLKHAFNLTKRADADGFSTWYTGLKIISDKVFECSIDCLCNLTNSEIFDRLKNAYTTLWHSNICKSDGGGKLDFYGTFKQSLCIEPYLDSIKTFKYRQAFSKLRISAHPLQVEVGRYVRPKIPRNERICKLCGTGSVEDEVHFLANCPAYSCERLVLYTFISDSCKHFSSMSDINKCIYMLTAENIATEISKYCFKNFEIRKSKLED